MLQIRSLDVAYGGLHALSGVSLDVAQGEFVAVVGPILAYAVLGTSRQLSVGPESTTALMTATALVAVGASENFYR